MSDPVTANDPEIMVLLLAMTPFLATNSFGILLL
jgi:hypothetical protein